MPKAIKNFPTRTEKYPFYSLVKALAHFVTLRFRVQFLGQVKKQTFEYM